MTGESAVPEWGHPTRPVRGDIWAADGATVNVTRVRKPCEHGAACGWADILVVQVNGASWTKRQPLPFPRSWTLMPGRPS